MYYLIQLLKETRRVSIVPKSVAAFFSVVENIKPPGSLNGDVDKKYAFMPDYNFLYFHDKNIYQNTTIRKWSYSELVVNISGFLSAHNINSDKPTHLCEFVSVEKNVKLLSPTEVDHCMAILANMKFNSCMSRVSLLPLDKKCSSCATYWSLESSLYVFDAWFVLKSQKAFHTQYFASVLSLWHREMSDCSKHLIVQVLYYLGLFKGLPQATLNAFKPAVMKHLSTFSPEEWAIVCLSFFRRSAKLEEESILLKTVESAKLLMANNTRFHCISTIKYLRSIRYYDKSLLQSLGEYILKEFHSFNFVECTNFLAAFTEENVYNEPVFTCLEKHVCALLMAELQSEKISRFSVKDHPSLHSRAKDVARFLWAITYIGHEPSSNTIEILLKVLNSKLDADEFRKQPYTLVDCLQSLAMMAIYPKNLLDAAFQTEFLASIWECGRVKPRYQLYFVLRAANIECHNWYQKCEINQSYFRQLKPLPKDIEQQVSGRDGVRKFVRLLNNLGIKGSHAKYCYVLSHLPVAGIFLSYRGSLGTIPEWQEGIKSCSDSTKGLTGICIEVLDLHTCARGSDSPLGFLRTKIRHLKELNYPVCVISSKEIDELLLLSSTEQKSWVSSRLSLRE